MVVESFFEQIHGSVIAMRRPVAKKFKDNGSFCGIASNDGAFVVHFEAPICLAVSEKMNSKADQVQCK